MLLLEYLDFHIFSSMPIMRCAYVVQTLVNETQHFSQLSCKFRDSVLRVEPEAKKYMYTIESEYIKLQNSKKKI